MVDEADVLDQDSAIALLTTAAEVGAAIALVGDRSQLPAVGRGGVLDIAAAWVTGSGGTVHDLDTVHRFTDPAYADLTLKLREGYNPASLFDRLLGLGLVQLHATEDSVHEQIALSLGGPKPASASSAVLGSLALPQVEGTATWP